MLQDLQWLVEHQLSIQAKPTWRWVGSVGLAIAVGIAYYWAARVSLVLLTKPDGVAVFWPAAGLAAGVLIVLGPSARLPVAAGAMGATIVARLLAGDPFIWGAIGFGLCNATEAVLVAWLIERRFGSAFSLGRLPCVLGLVAAALVGTAISGIGAATFVWFHSSTAPVLTTWYHWFASDALGIVTVAPLLIGLASAAHDPPPRSEIIDGVVPLMALALLGGLIIFLPREPWATVVPGALVFPFILWLAARCRPAFAAAAAFIIAFTVVWSTTFGIGFFGDVNFPIAERVLTAQAGILAVSLCALVLAALFSERRESEASLARSNMMLQRERNNKLMNLETMAASISHEVRQPLAGITTNGHAALRFLGHSPANVEEAQSALNRMIGDSHRVSQVFDNIRALFGKADEGHGPIDVNQLIRDVVIGFQEDLEQHGISASVRLQGDLPKIVAHKGQLQQVLINLVRNAIEAMQANENHRVLQVSSGRHDDDKIVLSIEDSGPGIDPKHAENIFEAFVTTKSHGMGLGLALCRMIIERHSGELSVSTAHPRGSIFRIVLPIFARDQKIA